MGALDAFAALHSSIGELAAAVRQTASGAGTLEPDSLAFHTAAAILFTLYSRVSCCGRIGNPGLNGCCFICAGS